MTAAHRPGGPGRPPPRGQRGAALLVAMLVTTLVATLAGAMVWQQWRAVQVEAAERARTQAAWILAGALDWARLILREDNRSGGADHLGEPWAVPLAEARMSSFLAADRDSGVVADDGPEAFLSGAITDAQSRFNLGNLVLNGRPQAGEIYALQRLFDHIGVAPGLAVTIAAGLRDAMLAGGAAAAAPPAGAESAPGAGAPGGEDLAALNLPSPNPDPPLLPQRLSQLAWFGIDAETLQRMRPYVTLLPAPQPAALTRVNVNTAPREVLAAVVDGLDLAGAERLVQHRDRSPFRDLVEASGLLGGSLDLKRLDVRTSYFEVHGRLRLGDRVVEERSLVRRVNQDVIALTRERVAGQDALP